MTREDKKKLFDITDRLYSDLKEVESMYGVASVETLICREKWNVATEICSSFDINWISPRFID